ncbi:MAG: PIN domain-containing protein [Nanoarchaeota archaeon]
MTEKYYFDTSIWLDLFENRDEPNLPKGKLAISLLNKIIKEGGKIINSEIVKNEMIAIGYTKYEIEALFMQFKKIILWVYSNKKQFGKAKDLSKKRDVPIFDALHAIIARDSGAIMVTRDKHFEKLLDIANYKKPEELI